MPPANNRGLPPTITRQLNRPTAIEPMIGHAKHDGRLGRNYLLGVAGDKINAILAAAGHNLRLVLRRLALLFARIPGAVVDILAAIIGISPATTAPAA
jgi:IS5 family transposase